MEKKRKRKPDPVLRRLGLLRMVLCVIAAACCAGIVVSAINLAAPPQKKEPEESTTETTTEPPTETTTEPETAPQQSGDGETNPDIKENSQGKKESGSVEGENTKNGEQNGAEGNSLNGEQGNPDNSDQKTPDNSDQKNPANPETDPSTTAPNTMGETTEPSETTSAITDATTEAENEPKEPEEKPKAPGWALPLLIGSISGLLLDLGGIVLCTGSINARKKELQNQHRRREEQKAYVVPEDLGTTQVQTPREQAVPGGMTVGSLQNIGGRPYQEDSSGVASLSDGVLAVVADGMGGLANGDKVSQKIVMAMMGYSKSLQPGQMDDVLPRMVQSVAGEVNKMLGPDGLYKSGSTLMTVLVRKNRFHWAAVGDSHIYLYRDGQLVQLNQEHNRGQELLYQAIAGEKTFDEVRADPKKSGLTSFVGMGELKYVDKSLYSMALKAGDRILLMTDGVFNALSDREIAAVLAQNPDVKAAAQMMERGVLAKAAPHQDNFTAVILGF